MASLCRLQCLESVVCIDARPGRHLRREGENALHRRRLAAARRTYPRRGLETHVASETSLHGVSPAPRDTGVPPAGDSIRRGASGRVYTTPAAAANAMATQG